MTIWMARVEWADPRALALRLAMDDEMTALYAERAANAAPGVAERITAVLVIDPGEMIATILAIDADADADTDADADADADGDEDAVEVGGRAPEGRIVGHAALRPAGDALEVKKVFVSPTHRGRGVSKLLLAEAETIARERGVEKLVLQTGNLQIEAIRLYERFGYEAIPQFRGYDAIPGSLCFAKHLG